MNSMLKIQGLHCLEPMATTVSIYILLSGSPALDSPALDGHELLHCDPREAEQIAPLGELGVIEGFN